MPAENPSLDPTPTAREEAVLLAGMIEQISTLTEPTALMDMVCLTLALLLRRDEDRALCDRLTATVLDAITRVKTPDKIPLLTRRFLELILVTAEQRRRRDWVLPASTPHRPARRFTMAVAAMAALFWIASLGLAIGWLTGGYFRFITRAFA